ncbi:MAG: ImmA/IrrE family metallo-endopeptidase [Planctomycetota bacterium]|nr:MAG: ImmA/IrrE family metallo-endopeptidase [Planctomycetota bacterium]
MLPELTTEEWSEALDAVAGQLIAELPSAAPPIDALRLARTLGLTVAWDERQPSRGRMARLAALGTGAGASILVRPDPRPERLQWAIAHEIGEFCAHRVFDSLAVDPREAPPAAREAVANHLASRILLPRASFAEDGRACDWVLFDLKARYASASHELIARRMLDMGPSVVITIFDHGRRTLRRSNLPFRVPPLGETESAAWETAHRQAVSVDRADYRQRVQAWPVHEPEWKREILRTEWFGD